jgi:hypothetical protein
MLKNMTTPKPKRRWFQYSLGTLLLLVLLASIGMSWVGAALRERAAAERIAELGGVADWGYYPTWKWWYEIGITGYGFFNSVLMVDYHGNGVADAVLENAKGLRQLQWLDLSGTQVTDAGLAHIGGLRTLRVLCLNNTQITDAGLEHIKGLSQLRVLWLTNTQVTDAGLKHLKGLKQLTLLGLYGTHIGDAGLDHLKGLGRLERLFLARTRVTDDGVKKLQRALPNCYIPPDYPSGITPTGPPIKKRHETNVIRVQW